MKRAYQSLMILNPEMPPFDNHMEKFEQRVRDTIAKEPFNSLVYEEAKKKYNLTASPPPQAATLYDTVKLYAVGLNKTIAKGEGIANGSAIIRNIRGNVCSVFFIQGSFFSFSQSRDISKEYSVLLG